MATVDRTVAAPRSAGPPVLSRVEAGTTPASARRRAARAFGEVVAETGDDGLRVLLPGAARALCELLGTGRCSLFLRDRRTDRFPGRTAHPASLNGAVRRLTMGGPSDALTADVLRTRAPVVVDDAGLDPRTARSAVRDLHVRSLLAIPLVHRDQVLGLAYVDDADRRRSFSADDERVAMAFCGEVARWIDRSMQVAQLAVARDELARGRSVLSRATLLEQLLAEHADADVETLLAVVARLAERPVELLRGDGTRLARVAAGDDPSHALSVAGAATIARELVDVDAGRVRTVGADLRDGLTHRVLATPLALDTEEGRALLVFVERERRLEPFDGLLAARCASAIAAATQRSTGHRARRADVHELLLGRLLEHGLDLPGTVDLAERLGVAVDAPRLVVVLDADADPAALESALAPRPATVIRTPQGPALVVDVRGDGAGREDATAVRDALVAALAAGGGASVVAVSAVTRDAGGLPRALAQARALLHAVRADATAGVRGWTVDELGPARLLLGDPGETARFAADVLGPLLDPDPAIRDLLATLAAFCAADANIRATAAALRIHENTVRHRFGRVRAMTGLDAPGSVEDLVLASAALAALRLSGAQPATS